MAKPAPRCVRCNQKMRNDGTAEQPQWVCNNPQCVRYVPPVDPEESVFYNPSEKEETN